MYGRKKKIFSCFVIKMYDRDISPFNTLNEDNVLFILFNFNSKCPTSKIILDDIFILNYKI